MAQPLTPQESEEVHQEQADRLNDDQNNDKFDFVCKICAQRLGKPRPGIVSLYKIIVNPRSGLRFGSTVITVLSEVSLPICCVTLSLGDLPPNVKTSY